METDDGTWGHWERLAAQSTLCQPTQAKSQSSQRALASASLAQPAPLLPTLRVGQAEVPTTNPGFLSQSEAPPGLISCQARPLHTRQMLSREPAVLWAMRSSSGWRRHGRPGGSSPPAPGTHFRRTRTGAVKMNIPPQEELATSCQSRSASAKSLCKISCVRLFPG